MTRKQYLSSLLGGACLLLTGCLREPLDELDTSQAALISPNGVEPNGISVNRLMPNRIGANRIGANRIGANRIGANRIGANRIGANRIGANRIGANRIGSNRIGANRPVGSAITERRLPIDEAVAGELLSTDEQRELFSYMASCAFESDVVLEGTIDGVDYEFPGSLGLAPAWEHRALQEHEQRWLSACLIARVNAYGVSVLISLRGPHRALTVSAAEAAEYTLEEGAFYGNIFTPETEPLEWTACRGSAQAAGEDGDLVDRDCTEATGDGTTRCGFKFAGDCVDYASDRSTPYACRRDDRGYYENCHTVAGHGRWPLGTLRTEVITVFVRPH
jgi:hypothetical protein